MEPEHEASEAFRELTKDSATSHLPIIILTNKDEVHARLRAQAASRVKRAFRQSALLSAIQYAIDRKPEEGEPLGDRILCVDDDPEILTFMGRCLENEGYQVDLCRSGEEALERAGSRDYGLVLLDIAMPGMDGWEACRRIKSERSLGGITIYMITAKPVDMEVGRAKSARADGYLMKPFRAEDLVDLVQGCQSLRTAKTS